jgi:hypothetical protein
MTNLTELSKEQIKARFHQQVANAKVDPIVFIDRFLYTFDPKRAPHHLPFRLFPFQKQLVTDIKEAIEKGDDIFIEKCREMGVTYVVLDVLLWFWLYVPGSNFLLGSRKEQYVDSTKGSSSEVINKEESLFGKLQYTLNKMYPFMYPDGFSIDKHMTYMSLVNPENGNVITGESSNPNFSRGGRFTAVLLDEFSFWPDDGAVWGSTADTTNCRIIVTTPGTRPSKAKRLRFGKDGEKIKIITLTHEMDPRKTREWLERERERRSTEDFGREIMINWETSMTGRVYPEIENAVFGTYPYNYKLPLYVSWDFGLDGVALQWWQRDHNSGKLILVDAYENKDKPIQWYFPLFGKPIDSMFDYDDDTLKFIEEVREWKGAVHFGDPDVAKRSLLTGTSTRQELSTAGIYVQTNPMANDFASRREKTKVMLQQGIQVNSTRGTDHWYDCIKESQMPERQQTSQATTEPNLPVHNWTSHHRTSTEYFAVNIDNESTPNNLSRTETPHNPKVDLNDFEGGWSINDLF